MKVRCIGHASLEIESQGLRLLTDPWWAGPAFAGQWHPFPEPQPGGVEKRDVDYIYLSHAHDDHLHLPTLRTLKRGATVLVPKLLTGSMSDRLCDELGFCEIITLEHGERVALRRGLVATCYVNVDESLLVLEDGDRTAVIASDALHEAPRAVIDHFCRTLRHRHGIPDVLFLGHEPGSWFPNSIRIRGKDDAASARAQAAHIGDNFLRIVDTLRPKVACAYAASFALVGAHERWVEQLRRELPTPDVLYRQKRPNGPSHVHLLLPNDVVNDLDIISGMTPKPTFAAYEQALANRLSDTTRDETLSAQALQERISRIASRLDASARAHRRRLGKRSPFTVTLKLRDAPGVSLFVEVTRKDARAGVGPAQAPGPVLETRLAVVERLLEDDDGIESFFVGGGGTAFLTTTEEYARIVDVLKLATPRERGLRTLARALVRRPLSSGKTLWRQRWPLALTLGARLGLLGQPFEIRPLDQESPERLREAA